jgi:hypothetical protein
VDRRTDHEAGSRRIVDGHIKKRWIERLDFDVASVIGDVDIQSSIERERFRQRSGLCMHSARLLDLLSVPSKSIGSFHLMRGSQVATTVTME